MQINDPIENPTESDGWGYRSKWQNKSGSVRMVSTNGGVHPRTWHKIDAATWEDQVRWAQQASEYSVYGSYDDSCDAIFWGIADTSGTRIEHNRYPDVNDPYYYYRVFKKMLIE